MAWFLAYCSIVVVTAEALRGYHLRTDAIRNHQLSLNHQSALLMLCCLMWPIVWGRAIYSIVRGRR